MIICTRTMWCPASRRSPAPASAARGRGDSSRTSLSPRLGLQSARGLRGSAHREFEEAASSPIPWVADSCGCWPWRQWRCQLLLLGWECWWPSLAPFRSRSPWSCWWRSSDPDCDTFRAESESLSPSSLFLACAFATLPPLDDPWTRPWSRSSPLRSSSSSLQRTPGLFSHRQSRSSQFWPSFFRLRTSPWGEGKGLCPSICPIPAAACLLGFISWCSRTCRWRFASGNLHPLWRPWSSPRNWSGGPTLSVQAGRSRPRSVCCPSRQWKLIGSCTHPFRGQAGSGGWACGRKGGQFRCWCSGNNGSFPACPEKSVGVEWRSRGGFRCSDTPPTFPMLRRVTSQIQLGRFRWNNHRLCRTFRF